MLRLYYNWSKSCCIQTPQNTNGCRQHSDFSSSSVHNEKAAWLITGSTGHFHICGWEVWRISVDLVLQGVQAYHKQCFCFELFSHMHIYSLGVCINPFICWMHGTKSFNNIFNGCLNESGTVETVPTVPVATIMYHVLAYNWCSLYWGWAYIPQIKSQQIWENLYFFNCRGIATTHPY